MDPQSVILLESVCQLGGVQRGIGLQRLFESVDGLLGELVRTLRSWTLRDQTRQPLRLEDRLGLIKGRSREAEIGGCLADRLAILPHPAQHLVLDLDQVAGVEEVIAGSEGGVANRLRSRIQSMLAAQG